MAEDGEGEENLGQVGDQVIILYSEMCIWHPNRSFFLSHLNTFDTVYYPNKDKGYKKTNNWLQFNNKLHRTQKLKPEHWALLDLEVSKSLILCIQGMKDDFIPKLKEHIAIYDLKNAQRSKDLQVGCMCNWNWQEKVEKSHLEKGPCFASKVINSCFFL